MEENFALNKELIANTKEVKEEEYDPAMVTNGKWIEVYKNDPDYGVYIPYLMELYRNLLFLRKYLRLDEQHPVTSETTETMDSGKIDWVRVCDDYIDNYLGSFNELHSLLELNSLPAPDRELEMTVEYD